LPVRHWHKLLVVGLCLTLADCGQKTQLVNDIPLPPFGSPRRSEVATVAAEKLPEASFRHDANSSQWIPAAKESKWRFIIIHHSASTRGNAASFDKAHRERGWDELGYHFVIGNGSLSGNGEIEVGPRWTKQKYGAHCGVRDHPEYNRVGIGICLVGHFNESKPSEAQMESLAQLVRWLMARYDIPKSRVLGHGMLKATDCPGKKFDYNDLYRRL